MKKTYLQPEIKSVNAVAEDYLMDVSTLDVYDKKNDEEVTEIDDLLAPGCSVWEE